MKDVQNGKGSQPRNNASQEFRDNYDEIFNPADRKKEAWYDYYRDVWTWEEFKKDVELCADCEYPVLDGECKCRGMGR
jgi:hypothetical protein